MNNHLIILCVLVLVIKHLYKTTLEAKFQECQGHSLLVLKDVRQNECTTRKTRDFVAMADDGFENEISSF